MIETKFSIVVQIIQNFQLIHIYFLYDYMEQLQNRGFEVERWKNDDVLLQTFEAIDNLFKKCFH